MHHRQSTLGPTNIALLIFYWYVYGEIRENWNKEMNRPRGRGNKATPNASKINQIMKVEVNISLEYKTGAGFYWSRVDQPASNCKASCTNVTDDHEWSGCFVRTDTFYVRLNMKCNFDGSNFS
jgi:hypothetical protein